jgi:metal-responsive CopG/Arc/MetJ family transcriptional regulator
MSTTTDSGSNKLARKPAGPVVGMRMPPKLLARLDAIIARRPDPKPTRAKVIRNLVRQALNARDERKGVRPPKRRT